MSAVILAAITISGCTSALPGPPAPTAHPVIAVRRLAIVPVEGSRFAVIEHRAEPGRTFDEVVKWTPHQWLRPFGALLHAGITWLLDSGRSVMTAPALGGVSPGQIVTEVLSRRLRESGSFQEVWTLAREPVGADRPSADALMRVSVPTWGVVRVRQGKPDLFSAFADVHAQAIIHDTGVIVWEDNEDVTHPERLTLESLTRDPAFTRQRLREVLERAGQRLASELLYARGGTR